MSSPIRKLYISSAAPPAPVGGRKRLRGLTLSQTGANAQGGARPHPCGHCWLPWSGCPSWIRWHLSPCPWRVIFVGSAWETSISHFSMKMLDCVFLEEFCFAPLPPSFWRGNARESESGFNQIWWRTQFFYVKFMLEMKKKKASLVLFHLS